VIILDTDHLSVLQSQGQHAKALIEKLDVQSDQDVATTAITIEEQMRGWLALIHRLRDVREQLPAYLTGDSSSCLTSSRGGRSFHSTSTQRKTTSDCGKRESALGPWT
jgi:hypothetical protein